ncbi:PKD domain-containing protein [Chloroflexota bacterium]
MLRLLLALVLTVLIVLPMGCSGDDSDVDAGPGDDLDVKDQGQGDDPFARTDGDDSEMEITVANKSPTVSTIALDPVVSDVPKNATVKLTASATDPDGDPIEYMWAATGGSFDSVEGAKAVWRAPEMTGSFGVTLTVTDGKGGTATAQQTFSVIQNEAPVIDSVSADPPSVGSGGRLRVSASAEDPDGDSLMYKWEADGGTLTGVGSSVTWVAPEVGPGEKTNYTITLTADDGRGGFDVETVDVFVAIGYSTRVFSPVGTETGTVIENGGSDTSVTRAGDNAQDLAMRAFFSFDFYELRDTDVSEATLEFTHQATVGDPFYMPTGLRGVHVYVVRWEEPGVLPEFYTEPLEELTDEGLFESPTTFDVTKFVERIGKTIAKTDKLQLMVTYQRQTNNDEVADYMEWSSATVSVTYAPD